MAGPICAQVKRAKWLRKIIRNKLTKADKPIGWTDAEWEDYQRRL